MFIEIWWIIIMLLYILLPERKSLKTAWMTYSRPEVKMVDQEAGFLGTVLVRVLQGNKTNSIYVLRDVCPGRCGSVGHCSAKWSVTVSIPGQGSCLGCGFGPRWGCIQETTDQCFTSMFLSASLPPFPSPFWMFSVDVQFVDSECHSVVAID